MKKNLYLSLVLSLFLLACSSEQKQPETSLEISPKFELPAEFQQEVGNVVNEYYAFKDALVQSDAKTAAERAKQLRTAIASVPTDTLEGSQAREVWFMIANEMNQISSEISGETDLERQRELFVDMTSNIEMMVNAFGVKGISMYKQHCPMAFNDTGANWFSSEPTIMNPYFGDRMLHCGTVEQTIAKSGK